jgi:hypothetical protein
MSLDDWVKKAKEQQSRVDKQYQENKIIKTVKEFVKPKSSAPDNLLDCKNCSDDNGQHQLMHHKGKKHEQGECMLCEIHHAVCPGFEMK